MSSRNKPVGEPVAIWEQDLPTAQQHLMHGLLLVALRLLTSNSIFSSCAADSDQFLFPIAAIFMTIPSSLLDSLLSSTCQSSTLCKFTKHILREVTSKLQALCTGHLCGLLPPFFQEPVCQERTMKPLCWPAPKATPRSRHCRCFLLRKDNFEKGILEAATNSSSPHS